MKSINRIDNLPPSQTEHILRSLFAFKLLESFQLVDSLPTVPDQQLTHKIIDDGSLIVAKIFTIAGEIFPFVTRQQLRAYSDLRLEAEFVGSGQKGVRSEEANVL